MKSTATAIRSLPGSGAPLSSRQILRGVPCLGLRGPRAPQGSATPASPHSAAGASPPGVYLFSCSKSGLEVLISFFFALSLATHSCRSQQSREGLGASPCETPTHSGAWGWCLICPWGAEQRRIVSHAFLLHLWSTLVDIYRQGFASSP